MEGAWTGSIPTGEDEPEDKEAAAEQKKRAAAQASQTATRLVQPEQTQQFVPARLTYDVAWRCDWCKCTKEQLRQGVGYLGPGGPDTLCDRCADDYRVGRTKAPEGRYTFSG